jgi:hypothetical protein
MGLGPAGRAGAALGPSIEFSEIFLDFAPRWQANLEPYGLTILRMVYAGHWLMPRI